MSSIPRNELLVVPDSLKRQLASFKRRVWSTKMLESLALGGLGILLAFLTVYVVDRLIDTPRQARFGLFVASLLLWLSVPRAFAKWVWRHRSLPQIARLLRVKEPSVGDQLLSVIELADNEDEQKRSRTLCAAAISQVADSAASKDFRRAAPRSFVIELATALLGAGAIAAGLSVLFPSAAANAWQRYLSPWKPIPRYTFTTIEKIPNEVIVPHGEAVPFEVVLAETSSWKPDSAQLKVGAEQYMTSTRADSSYPFELPAQLADTNLKTVVGDYYTTVNLQPKLRPELIAAKAQIDLPAYLQQPSDLQIDVRSGSLVVVEGSTATIEASASRDLARASVGETSLEVAGDGFSSLPIAITSAPQVLSFRWIDEYGLNGKAAFDLSIEPVADEAPSVIAQGLPSQTVILDEEQINFEALAADDFGVKKIGISWKSLDEEAENYIAGESLISSGGPTNTSMQVAAIFSAAKFKITPQAIEVRLWVEDFKPDRGKIYGPPHSLFVLEADQHAMWISNQLSKWHRASLDVRDKELQLFAANKELRDQFEQDGSSKELLDQLNRQAGLEAANARRLRSLSKMGEDLLRQAARNPKIGVENLEQWAQMLKVLNDIGKNRMPSVSDLLNQAAKAKQSQAQNKPQGPQAGKVRAMGSQSGEDSEEPEEDDEQKPSPSIQDIESSMQSPDDAKDQEKKGKSKKQKGGPPRLGMPNTSLIGPKDESDPEDEEPADEQEKEDELDRALAEQEELLSEFEKIADELNELLANLEGSTLVKRLKAESRQQDSIARDIGVRVDAFFGVTQVAPKEDLELLSKLKERELESIQSISYIMDDMQSFYERRRMDKFRLILEEMKELEVLVALRELSDLISSHRGMSIAQAEFWADTLDRWAEDLVDVPEKKKKQDEGESQGAKEVASLPPKLILEMLKILEGEVNLREATRVVQQSRPLNDLATHAQECAELQETQDILRERTNEVINALVAMPEGRSKYEADLLLFSQVSSVMTEVSQLLEANESGSTTIAAETEVIELLLQSNRVNPESKGGGGMQPGQGKKSGDTDEPALALLGSGLNQNEKREPREVEQATGEVGRTLPEEFRAGLDKYFEAIERSL